MRLYTHIVCFSKQRLWKLAKKMKESSLRVGDYCVWTLERFLQKSLDFPGSNIKSYSAFFVLFVQMRSWTEPSCYLHQDLMARCFTVFMCKRTSFSLEYDLLFQLSQMALNSCTSYIICTVYVFLPPFFLFECGVLWVWFG